MNKLLSFKYLLFLISLIIPFSLFSQDDGRMDWWKDARYGMFIHWGPYAVYGNVYNGVNIHGEYIKFNYANSRNPSEWIMHHALIPREEYRKAALEFDAKDYNPKAWVQLAKDAGMKYIVITTKHHDGFCLFDTDYTDWNAVKASAAKRDLLDEFVKEVKAAGLKLGFYYSQNRDWMFEGGMGPVPELNREQYPLDKVNKYVDELVIPHIKELTSRYDFDLMWFDGPRVANSNNDIAQRIHDALMESPVGDFVFYNDRLLEGWAGSYETPETDTPSIPYNGYEDNRNWEACASLTESWGWENTKPMFWKTGLYTLSRVLELTSKGGNFLLNIGPDKHGAIPEEAQETLREVGEWLSRNGESVYGTTRNRLLNPFQYGYITEKEKDNGELYWYLHVSTGVWDKKEIYLGFAE